MNHFHKGRGFPISYVRNCLALNKPYEVTMDTKIETIIEHFKGLGVDYESEWTDWYDNICIGGTLRTQNWQPDDFKYVVQDSKVYDFSVKDGKVEVGDAVLDVDPPAIQAKDKVIFQQYGRPYNEAGKPGGTYIQKPLEPKIGEGGYKEW